jgi:hypothetical protein
LRLSIEEGAEFSEMPTGQKAEFIFGRNSIRIDSIGRKRRKNGFYREEQAATKHETGCRVTIDIRDDQRVRD